MFVTKRDGSREPFDLEKFHRVTEWACDGLSGVSASEIELHTQIHFYDGIKTSDVMEAQIKAAAELISEDNPNYQYAAGRLVNSHLRKIIYGSFNPPSLFDHYSRVVGAGHYSPELTHSYSPEEWEKIDSFLNHDRDMYLTHAAMELFREKYLVKDRITGQIFETPQMAMVLIAMCLFQEYPKEERLGWVQDYYDAISTFDISLPTPIMAGVRTPHRQFSSCTLIECDDSLDSISATTDAIVRYVSHRAGIGIAGGKIRALNSPVRGGSVYHTGVVPFFQMFQAAVKSCSQGGSRVGSATLYFPLWHLEIEDVMVLKNNRGTEETRARRMDYGIQLNKLMYERLLSGGKITLFSPSDVPGLYEAFFSDQEEFRRLYETAERNTRLRKKVVSAIELFSTLMQERKDTGRIYIMNVDHCNSHGSFLPEIAPVRMSNLCAEVTLPTKPIYQDSGEIALCILSAINWGKIKKPEDFERPCRLAVRGLDALIDYQSYPLEAARFSAEQRRPLGIGLVNLAYWLAKNGTNYSDPNLELVDEYAEAFSFYLIKASVELAKEKGPCALLEETKWDRGVIPMDTRKPEVDELISHHPKLDWGGLRSDIQEFGIRNSTLMALMPAETSALISNSTNGIEPPRALVSIKQSKDGVVKQVVPEVKRLKNKYELLWDQRSPEGYLRVCAVLQKWVDQSISVNTSYNPKFYPDGRIPMSELLRHLVWCYRAGIKTLYYFNTNDSAGEIEVKQEECEACVL